MKKQITIPAKMSNTGNIYDIASDNYDIVISMGEHFQYAVCLPSYYNTPATRHRTEQAAIAQYKKLVRDEYLGAVILDRDGDEMLVCPRCDYDELVKA